MSAARRLEASIVASALLHALVLGTVLRGGRVTLRPPLIAIPVALVARPGGGGGVAAPASEPAATPAPASPAAPQATPHPRTAAVARRPPPTPVLPPESTAPAGGGGSGGPTGAAAFGTCASAFAAGGTAVAVQVDIADAAAVDHMVTRAVSEFGRLDCAFNNAGVAGKPARTLRSGHGGAYELGMRERDHGVAIAPFGDD